MRRITQRSVRSVRVNHGAAAARASLRAHSTAAAAPRQHGARKRRGPVSENIDWSEVQSPQLAENLVWTDSDGFARRIMLNRPHSLNALNSFMLKQIERSIHQLEENKYTSAILLRSVPPAKMLAVQPFCVGLDLKAVHQLAFPGPSSAASSSNLAKVADVYAHAYRIAHHVSKMRKQFLPCMDGVTSGAGFGLCAQSRLRVATENSKLSFPETGMGFVPDCGASHTLSRLAGSLGMFLGLTGHTLSDYDLIHAGLATHFWTREGIRGFESSLADSWGTLHSIEDLIQFTNEAYDRAGERAFSLERQWDLIDECFGKAASVEDIIASLQSKNTPFSNAVAKQLLEKSPLALKVAFKLLRDAGGRTLSANLQAEYRVLVNALRGQDYWTGLRSRLDGAGAAGAAPKWSHASLAKVSDADVAKFFTLPEGVADVALPEGPKAAERVWWGEVVYPYVPVHHPAGIEP